MRSALVLCILAACYHDPAPSPVTPNPARSPRVNAAASDPLGFLPVDSELVMSIDANQVRASGLWKLLDPAVSARAGDELARFRSQCGVRVVMTQAQLESVAKMLGAVMGGP